ncbi:MAG: chromosome partitioning protein [Psychrobacter glaciei]|jgi:chromosome partitioning protein
MDAITCLAYLLDGPVNRKLNDPIGPQKSRVISRPPPKKLLVANAKGGSGKTTIATNVAAYFAQTSNHVAIIDYDPQGSSSQWVKERTSNLPFIYAVDVCAKGGVASTRSFQLKVPSVTTHIIMDTPAGLAGVNLSEAIRQCDAILIPIVPSAIDIRAATSFIKDVLLSPGFRRQPKPIAVIANRVKRNTLGYNKLEIFLNSLNIPFIATIRDTQHYVRGSELGMGVYDFSSPNEKDEADWQPLLAWLNHHLDNKTKK